MANEGHCTIEIMPEATDRLQLENTWLDDGRLFALWRPHSRAVLKRTRLWLLVMDGPTPVEPGLLWSTQSANP